MITQVLEKPLGILDKVEIPEEALDVFRKLEEVEFPYVREKLIENGEVSKDEIDAVEFEFKRFLSLTYLVDGRVGMTSKKVDAYWHQLILFTRQYFDFCITIFGFFVHHQPKTTLTPLDPNCVSNFRQNYTRYFGEIPLIWLKDESCKNCSDIGTDCHGDGQCGGDGE